MRCDEKSIEILFYVIGLRNRLRHRQRHNKISASPPSSILTTTDAGGSLLYSGGCNKCAGLKWQAWRAGSIMNFIMFGLVTGNAFCYYCAGSIYEIFSIAVMPMMPPCSPAHFALRFLSFLVCATTPKITCKILTHALPMRAACPSCLLPPSPFRALRVAEWQSLAARWLGSLLRLTPTSAVQFCSVKRARFRLGSFLV